MLALWFKKNDVNHDFEMAARMVQLDGLHDC